MLVDVVCLRRAGVKLSAAMIHAAVPVRGHLIIETKYPNPMAAPDKPRVPSTYAAVTAQDPPKAPSLLPMLFHVRVTRLDGDSLVIVGGEQPEGGHARDDAPPQAWWVRIVR